MTEAKGTSAVAALVDFFLGELIPAPLAREPATPRDLALFHPRSGRGGSLQPFIATVPAFRVAVQPAVVYPRGPMWVGRRGTDGTCMACPAFVAVQSAEGRVACTPLAGAWATGALSTTGTPWELDSRSRACTSSSDAAAF